MRRLLAGQLDELAASIDERTWPQLASKARQLLLRCSATAAPHVLTTLEGAAQFGVRLPALRGGDIWHAHVLFFGDEVSGLVDFGAMRPENVAADVARLLGSLVGDERRDWQRGLAAYEAIRPMSEDEPALLAAFDRSTVLLGGLQWLEWIYVERHTFADQSAVLERVDEFLARLTTLSQVLA